MNKNYLLPRNVLLSMAVACAYLPISSWAQPPMANPEPISLNNKTVKTGETWQVLRDHTIKKLTIAEGARINVPGKALTMLVDGIDTPIEPGTYSNVQLIKSTKFSVSPAGVTGRGVDNYRPALYIGDKGIDKGHSVEEAIQSGNFDNTLASNLNITSRSANMNGVMVDGAIDYTINNAKFDFRGNSDGSDINDFSGFGAAVAAYNGAHVHIKNSSFDVAGVARSAIYVYEDADVLLEDSTINVEGGELYDGYINSADFSSMVAPPWVLGITGTARGTNMMGNRTSFTLVRSKVNAANWGVVSTDFGAAMVLTLVDSDLSLNGKKNVFSPNYGSGYAAYILGSDQFYYGVNIKSGTYAGIIRDGRATYKSSNFAEPLAIYPLDQTETGKTSDFLGNIVPVFTNSWAAEPVFTGIKGSGRNTYIQSDNFGWMSHGDGGVTIADGTVVETGRTAFLLKDGNVDVTVESGAKIEAGNGVILQIMDNDDQLVGLNLKSDVEIHFNSSYHEPKGYPGLDYKVDALTSKNRSNYTFTARDVKLHGDIYNSTGWLGGQPGDLLTVTLGSGAQLDGVISATSSVHVDEHDKQLTDFTDQQYYYLGHLSNKILDSGVNDVNVVLNGGAKWNVTGKSLIRSLDLDTNSVISSGNCGKPTMTIDGKSVALEPGHYKGMIVIEPCVN